MPKNLTYFLARRRELKERSMRSKEFNLLETEFWSKIWYSFFLYPFLNLRKKILKKRPTILKFDVWEESSLEIAKVRHLPFLIKKIFNPKKIYFLDIDRKLLALARRNMKYFGFEESRVLNGNITAMPFEDNSFDLIVDFSTTDHLNDLSLSKAVKEIRRVLRKNGLLIMYHLNAEYFNIKKFNSRYKKENLFPSFPRKFETLQELLKRDFEILNLKYCLPFFADSTLYIYYRFLYRKIYKFLPRKLLFSFFNSPKLNLFFYLIAKKVR